MNTVAQGPGQASYHGHADRASEEEIDRRRYYQAVDTYLLDHYSNPNQRRLILFGLPENIAVFREISRNPHLSGSMQVEQNPGNMSLGDIDLALDDLRQDYADRHADETLALLETARGSGKYVEDSAASLKRCSSARWTPWYCGRAREFAGCWKKTAWKQTAPRPSTTIC